MNNSHIYRQFEDEPIEQGRGYQKITVETRREVIQSNYTSRIQNGKSPWLEDNSPGAMDFSQPPPHYQIQKQVQVEVEEIEVEKKQLIKQPKRAKVRSDTYQFAGRIYLEDNKPVCQHFSEPELEVKKDVGTVIDKSAQPRSAENLDKKQQEVEIESQNTVKLKRKNTIRKESKLVQTKEVIKEVKKEVSSDSDLEDEWKIRNEKRKIERQNLLKTQVQREVKYAKVGSKKSLQLQQYELEQDNKNSLKWAIGLRSFSRIMFLMIISTLIFTGFYIIYTYYAFHQGAVRINQNANINLNVTNCKLNIIDSEFKPTKHLGQSAALHLKTHGSLKHPLDDTTKSENTIGIYPDIALVYVIPGRFSLDSDTATSQMAEEIKGNDYSYSFTNILSAQSCQIDLHIYKETKIDNLIINCFQTCYMMIMATNITFNNFNITGDLIEVNAPYLVANNFSFNAIQGRFQGGYVDFTEYADIRLENGDIILQTDKELMVNWTHANPHYCFGSPVIANPIVIGCQEPPDAEVSAYINGVGTGELGESTTESEPENNGSEKDKDNCNDNNKDDVEQFFNDKLNGSVVLLPFLNSYKSSKTYKQQHMQDNDPESTKKPNMKSKTKEQSNDDDQLFQPSCYGTSVLCQTKSCSTLKEKQSDDNNSKFRTMFNENSTQNNNPVDYKALNKEAQEHLPHVISPGVRFLNITARFGNVYINLIQGQNKTIRTKDTIMNGQSYSSGNVEFDLPSQKYLAAYLKLAKDPHNFDPNFILEVGSKVTRSHNFQQWQVTYNPAYSYIRPWWIGTFSFTLMSTASWDLKLNLSPGFCPYMPNLNLNDIYATRFLIDKYFKDATNAITTLAWQNSIHFPNNHYNTSSNGVRDVVTSNDEFEKWVQIVKLNESDYRLTNINLVQSPATQWAVYISLSIAVLMAGILIIGVVYMVNSVYLQIIEQVQSTTKYGLIEKKNDQGSQQPLMKRAPDHERSSGSSGSEEELLDYEADIIQTKFQNTRDRDNKTEFEIILNFNPTTLFYQLFVLAPPLSAFIDYLCVLLSKKYINSAKEFYQHLFRENSRSNLEQLHDLRSEAMLGNDLKTLYEKYCYLNGYLEQKLDDDGNMKYLRNKGFKIEEKQDAQTESYIRVLLNGTIPKIDTISKDKTSLDLFIEQCCKTSNFDEDNIVAITFNEQYQQFCTLNHFQYEQLSAAELQRKYNIQSKYIPQQWVVRDDGLIPKPNTQDANKTTLDHFYDCLNTCSRKCCPQKNTYSIDRQKMQNHFLLIMNKPEKIGNVEELAMANQELILFGGWWAVDFITVIAHFITTIILVIPLFGFTLLDKVLYSPYSLIPIQYIITLEDVIQNYWVLPTKFQNESQWIKYILILVAIYWVYSIIDLIYYYLSMEFPQENFFRKVQPKTAHRIQKLFRQIMWALVLYSAFQLCAFLALAVVWLLLGAIVNPTEFLPYATAAATFVTVVSTKAAQFKEIASEGFGTVIQYVQNIAKTQMSQLMKKMEDKLTEQTGLNSESLKIITEQGLEIGLNALNQHQQKQHQKSTEIPVQEDSKIDPIVFRKQNDEKAIQMITEQSKKQVDEFGEQLGNIIVAMFRRDKSSFKHNMQQLMYAAGTRPNSQDLMTMGKPIMHLIWEFSYPTEQTLNLTPRQYQQYLLQPVTECISGLLQQAVQQDIDQKQVSTILAKSISLQKNLKENRVKKVFEDIEEIILKFNGNESFVEITELSKYGQILQVAMYLFDGKQTGQLSFHKIFNIVAKLFDDIPNFKVHKDLLGLIEILVNSIRKQSVVLPTKTLRQKIYKAFNYIQDCPKAKNLDQGQQEISINKPLITLLFNFMTHSFDKLPKEMMKEVLTFSFTNNKECGLIQTMVQSEKEMKYLIRLMTGCLEMMQLFMEDPKELTSQLHRNAPAFNVDIQKAEQLQNIATLKYLQFITFEGSNYEEEIFDKLDKNPIIINLSNKLRLDIKLIKGIVSLLLNLQGKRGLQDLALAIARINKTQVNTVKQFIQILVLLKSHNHSHLVNAALYLQIPKDYVILILISKRILDLNYIDFDNLFRLGVTTATLRELKSHNKFHYLDFIEKLKIDILLNKDVVVGGSAKQLKLFILETINNPGLHITEKTVSDILLALSNNMNEFAKLNQNEIELLTNILQLKNFEVYSNVNSLTSDTKQAVYAFATVLNVNKVYFEDLINIVFLNSPDRVVNSIQHTQPIDKQFIQGNETQDFEYFLAYLYSRMEQITKNQNFIYQNFQNIFPNIKFPKALIEKLLLNPAKEIGINAYYKLAYLIIGKTDDGQLPEGTLSQLSKSIAFLTSTLNCSDLLELRVALGKKDLTQGQGMIIAMLCENSRHRALSIFLEYMQNNIKRNKNDVNNPVPQVCQIFSCLYLFFTGQSRQVQVDYEDPITHYIRQVSLIEFISLSLDIKVEFFEALHTFYLKDNKKFTEVMIKFMRRYQASKFERENPGIKIPLQSLVKIPDPFVLNFINLITGQPYSASFFAKELEFDPDVVQLISTLMKIKTSNNKDRMRSELAQLASSTTSIGQLLQKVKVVGHELRSLLKLIFQDYELGKLQWMMDDFKLESKVKINQLNSLLLVDNVINLQNKNDQCFTQLQQQIEGNELIKNMGVPESIVMLAKIQVRGMHGCLESCIKKLPFLDYGMVGEDRQDYFGLLQGLSGCISGVIPDDFNVRQFLGNLYKQLNDNTNKEVPELQIGSNSIQFAYYQLCKTIQIDPMILMLTQGVIPAWETLTETYAIMLNKENKWLNPIIVFQVLLLMQAFPTMIQELFTEVEWYETAERIQYTNSKLNWDGLIKSPMFKVMQKEVQMLKEILFARRWITKQEFMDFSENLGIDPKLIKYLQLSDAVIQQSQSDILLDSIFLYSSQSQDTTLQDLVKIIRDRQPRRIAMKDAAIATFEDIINQCLTEQAQREYILNYKPRILLFGLIQVYKEVSLLFVDPRFKSEEMKQAPLDLQITKQMSCTQTPYFNLGICTRLAILRQAYWRPINRTLGRDEENYKIVAGHIDYILTSIDRFYHYQSFMTYFSKPKAATIIGLAAGFAFTADHFIQANCTASLASQERIKDLQKLMKQPRDGKTANKWRYIRQLINDRDKYTKRDSRFFKIYKFNLISQYGLDIYTEPEKYIENSIQISSQTKQLNQGFNWEDYFYDISFLENGSDLIKLAMYKGLPLNLSNQQQIILGNHLENNVQLDVKSNQQWSNVLKSQELWSQACYTKCDNFRLLIDIFKGNYISILAPDNYFMDDEASAAQVYYGLVALSGSYYKVKNGWKMNTAISLSKYLSSCCWNTQSNKRILQELLSIYLQNFEGLYSFSQATLQNPKLIQSFISLSCNLEASHNEKFDHLDQLINATKLPLNDRSVLKTLIKVYLGDVTQYYALAEFSKYITPAQSTKFKIAALIKRTRKSKMPLKVGKYLIDQNNYDSNNPMQKIIKKLLFSLNQSELHNVKAVEDINFDFTKYSSLTWDPNRNDEDFILLLWQLAQTVTVETLPENLTLPLLTESDLRIPVDKSPKQQQYNENKQSILSVIKLVTALISDDYSYFFLPPEEISESLQVFGLIRTQEFSKSDLQFLKSMIGLKPNKMQSILSKQRDNNQLITDSDIADQIQNLYDQNIIKIEVPLAKEKVYKNEEEKEMEKKKNDENNQRISMNVAKLFLAISSGNIHLLVESFIDRDGMSACTLLSLYLWKNLTTIITNGLNDNQEDKIIIPAIQVLPLLLYSQIIDNQDKQSKVAQQQQQVVKIFEQFTKIIELITKTPPNKEFYNTIQQLKEQNKQPFSWSQWISKIQLFLSPMITKEYISINKLVLKESYFIIKFLTGFHLVEKINTQYFISQLFTVYLQANILINFPEDNNNEITTIPQTVNVLNSILKVVDRKSLEVFDQFVQLFIFIQISPKTKQIAAVIPNGEEKEEDSLDNSMEMDEVQIAEIKPDEVIEGSQLVITKLVLKVLSQTVDGLWESFNDNSEQYVSLKTFKQVKYFETKNLIQGIIILLTSHDIYEKNPTITYDLKKDTLIYILDVLLFQNVQKEFMNCQIVEEILLSLEKIAQQQNRIVQDKDFLISVISLIEVITGQNSNPDQIQPLSQFDTKIENQHQGTQQKYTPIQGRNKIVTLPIDMIKQIFRLTSYDLTYIGDFLKQLKVGESNSKILENVILQVQQMGAFSNKPLAFTNTQVVSEKQQRITQLIKKIEDGTAQPQEIFLVIDADNTGSISKQEYGILAKRLGMNLSDHRINEIFASIKKGSIQDESLNEEEFGRAMLYLQQKNTNMTLDFLGISPALLTMALILMAIILLLTFVFIFLGINAFALGGTFGAVVNSILPMAAGFGAGTKVEKLKDKQTDSSISDSVEKTQKIIQSDKI